MGNATRDRKSDELAANLLANLRRMIHAIHARSASIESALHLTSPQYWLLRELAREERAVTLGEVARILAVHKTNASRLVDRLIEKGLVAAQRSAKDRRVVHVKLTRRGARIANRKLPAPPQADLLVRLRDLPPRELQLYASTVEKLVRLMGAQDEEPMLLFDERERASRARGGR